MTKIRWKISILWYSITEKCGWKKLVAGFEGHGISDTRSAASQNRFCWHNYIKLKLIDQMNLNEDNEADLGLSAQFI